MIKNVIRVFPRKTNATPDDENVRFGLPTFFDAPERVLVSVAFTWDIPHAEYLAEQWRSVCKDIQVGGPAYDDPGDVFVPGLFVKRGYVFTSRGCPNKCWFCVVPKREGIIRELPIVDGWNVLDSNLLACSDLHIQNVFAMLGKQKERPRFTGGLEAARMRPWIAEALRELKPSTAYFAYDTPDDYEPLTVACKMLMDVGALPDKANRYFCYTLIGYRGDTIEKAEKRLRAVMCLGIIPMAMLYNLGEGLEDVTMWKRFQREWANHFIVGRKIQGQGTE